MHNQLLEVSQEVEFQILDTPPCLVPLKPNHSSQLATLGDDHAVKNMFNTGSDG